MVLRKSARFLCESSCLSWIKFQVFFREFPFGKLGQKIRFVSEFVVVWMMETRITQEDESIMAKSAMFAGLVVDEEGKPTEIKWVGEDACYVVDDDGFLRHIDAAQVDRQVLRFMREQVDDNRELAVDSMLEMMGKDDIFTKAAVESSINNIEDAVGQQIPEQARQWLGMMGFRIVIDYSGNVIDIEMPGGGIDEEGEW